MKKAVKVLGIAFLSMLMVKAVYSQRNMDPERMADRQTQMIVEKVSGLSDQQKDSVKQINTDFAKMMSDAWSGSNGDRSGMREKMQGMRQEHDARLKAVFTDDQYQQYQKMQDSMRQARRAGRGRQ